MYDYLLAHTDIIRNGFSAAGITEWLKYYYYLLNQFMAAFSTVAILLIMYSLQILMYVFSSHMYKFWLIELTDFGNGLIILEEKHSSKCFLIFF